MATITANNGAAGNFQDGSSWVGGVAPTAADDAVLPVGCTSMTIGTGSVCRSLTTTAFTGTLTHTAGVTLTIGDSTAGAGNVALAFGTFTYTLGDAATSAISFISTSATTQTVNFNGKTTGNVTFNASSNGSWQYTGGHTVGSTATVTFTKGTLDINGQTCSWGSFISQGGSVRALTLGAANITITKGSFSDVWLVKDGSLTLSAASSTITFSAADSQMGGPVGTYGTLVFAGGTHRICSWGSQVCTNCTFTGTASKTNVIMLSSNLTVSGVLTIAGNSSINRMLVRSDTIGTSRTFTNTGATMTISNADFQDITMSTTWDASARTDIGDCGGCSGITFPASVAQTWSGTSGGNWSANAWTTRVPLPQDDVSLGVAFSASQTVTADMPRLGRSISWTGATGSPTFTNGSLAVSAYGNVTLISGMTVAGTGTFSFSGRGNYSITSSGNIWTQDLNFVAPTGTYTLNDSFVNNNKTITLSNGTLDSSGFSITSSLFTSTGSATRSLILGNSILTLTNTTAASLWNVSSTLTLSAASSTIVYSVASANTRTFQGQGLTYGTLTYTVAGSTGGLDIGNANGTSFAQINFYDASNARSLKFTKATTTTIRNTNGFNVQGTSGKLMTIDTIDGAGVFTLTSTNRQVCSYLNVVRSTVDASPAWYAQTTSTDGGTNTNWIFTNAPALATSGGSNGIQNRMNLQNLRSLI